MLSIKTFAASALIGAGLAAAQAQISITQSCQTTLLGMLASPEISECAALGDLLTIGVLAMSDPVNATSTSLVPAFGTWFTDICAAKSCSNATLSKIVTDLAGCNSDLSDAFGIIIPDDATDIIANVQAWYPSIREAVCLKTNHTFCLSQTFDAIQNATGIPITLNAFSSGSLVSALTNTSLVCDDCMHSAYVTAQKPISDIFGPTLDSMIVPLCGASFVNGTISPDVHEAAASGGKGYGKFTKVRGGRY